MPLQHRSIPRQIVYLALAGGALILAITLLSH
jgi:hypothetical protein